MAPMLGIDHPLVAVRDLSTAIETYRSLGFFIAPPGMHPWGTSTALALFRHQILELVSIGDAALLDGYQTGEFRFGRHIERYLNQSEGVALSALFTQDATAAEQALAARGLACSGTVNFGRDVVRADGHPDRTKTTLKIFHNETMPRLSVFACQQHRRDLLEFPDRMTHPNSAHGFEAATIVTGKKDKGAVLEWLQMIHGAAPETNTQGHATVPTTNGSWRIVTPAQFETLYGCALPDRFLENGPRVAALDVRVRDMATVRSSASQATCDLLQMGNDIVVNDMQRLGGIVLRFVAVPPAS